MSITSNAFGRVTLTGQDAKKFKNQVVYGKPKQAAIDNVKLGIALARKLREDGRLTIAKPANDDKLAS